MTKSTFIILFLCLLCFTLVHSQDESDSKNKVIDVLTKLQENPYKKWPTGSKFTIQFSDYTKSFEDSFHYVQPKLKYTIGKDTLSRVQNIKGVEYKQSFSINNELGLRKLYNKDNFNEKGKDTVINVDGINVLTNKTEDYLDWIGEDSGGTKITKRWVWKKFPFILLREECGDIWWAISSFQEKRKVNNTFYECVEVKNNLITVDGYVLETVYYSPKVPGFVVERKKEFYKTNEKVKPKLYMITHESICDIKL